MKNNFHNYNFIISKFFNKFIFRLVYFHKIRYNLHFRFPRIRAVILAEVLIKKGFIFVLRQKHTIYSGITSFIYKIN